VAASTIGKKRRAADINKRRGVHMGTEKMIETLRKKACVIIITTFLQLDIIIAIELSCKSR
jgi:hypothetical protein